MHTEPIQIHRKRVAPYHGNWVAPYHGNWVALNGGNFADSVRKKS